MKVNTNKLRGYMAEQGMTGVKMAEYCGISAKTFYSMMKSGAFNTKYMYKIIECLQMPNDKAIEIFLSQK